MNQKKYYLVQINKKSATEFKNILEALAYVRAYHETDFKTYDTSEEIC